MIRVFIVEDHVLVREGLKRILAETPDIQTVDETGNGRDVIKKIRENNFDLVLLDISLPDSNGLDILKQTKAIRPDLGVLIVSAHPEDHYAVRALKAGASGYVTKTRASSELIDAIRKVAAGQMYVSSSLAEKLAWDLTRVSRRDDGVDGLTHEQLSDREFQVLTMIASGKTVSQLAHELSLSVKTVSTYRARLMNKMNMKTNAELTNYGIQNKLVTLPS